jgi:hypothetical protein
MPGDFHAVRLVINAAGMVDVTAEYRELSEPKVFGESACVLG